MSDLRLELGRLKAGPTSGGFVVLGFASGVWGLGLRGGLGFGGFRGLGGLGFRGSGVQGLGFRKGSLPTASINGGL